LTDNGKPMFRPLLHLFPLPSGPCKNNSYSSREDCREGHSSVLDNNQAFTLLEVMIAISIIAIALTALFGSQSRSLSLATEAQFNTIAPMLASVKLAELEGRVLSPEDDDGDFGDDFPGYTWSLEADDAIFESPEDLANLTEPLKKINLTVLWSETKYSYSLTYYGRWPD
jgi:general secretion pathway protein I